MPSRRTVSRAKNIAVVMVAFLAIGVILWLDIATSIWSDLVIIAGLAAGLVSFLLTALVINRLLARSTERKWAPVSRLALTEFLHSIADEQRSEISRGRIVLRTLPGVDTGMDHALTEAALHELRERILDERSRLALTLSRWTAFLASSGNYADVLRHSAEIALRLDTVRDATLEAERVHEIDPALPTESTLAVVNAEIAKCNAAMQLLGAELRARIADEDRLVQAR